MKRVASSAVAILMLSVAGVHATMLRVAPQSTLSLDGSTNLASWRCSGSTLEGVMEIEAPLDKINDLIDHIEDGQIGAWMSDPAAARMPQPQFELTIPIAALRCSGGRPMERDLVAALRAARYPGIRVRFRELRGSVEHDIDAHVYRMAVATEVSLAGVTREVEVTIAAERLSRDSFRIQAAVPLEMTEFGVAPPRALFGLIKAANRLTVNFSLILRADADA